jgi:hypothetical protein
MRFLSMIFAGDFMRAELYIYQYAARFLSYYDGGVWEFAQLPAGGGIIIIAQVLNHRCWMYDRHDEDAIFHALDGLTTRAALPPHHAMRAVGEGDSTSGSEPI